MVTIKKFKVGPLKTNCYIITTQTQAIVFDPGFKSRLEFENIFEYIADRKILGIFYTHGHFDHILGSHYFDEFDIKHYINEEELPMINEQTQLTKEIINTQLILPKKFYPLPSPIVSIGNFKFEVIKTPGHTKGGVCYLFDEFIITGDTLFKQTHGRVDLPYSNSDQMHQSLKTLIELDKNLVVYPGHGSSTILKDEIEWIKNDLNI